MVYIPGVVLQLVDCGAQHEPCHHIALLEKDSPFPPGHESTETDSGVALTYFDLVKQRSARSTYGLCRKEITAVQTYFFNLHGCHRSGSL